MIAHTTATLSGSLARAMNINIKQVVLAPVEQVLGKLKDRGLQEKLPAMAVDRKGIKINRENIARSTAARRGFPIGGSAAEGEIKMLHTLPIRLIYDIGVFAGDRDQLDFAESNFLWFIEEMGGGLEVSVKLDNVEFTLPIQIALSVTEDEFDIDREEEWDKARLYKMTFSLEVTSFLLRSSLKPTILNIDYKISDYNGITLVEL